MSASDAIHQQHLLAGVDLVLPVTLDLNLLNLLSLLNSPLLLPLSLTKPLKPADEELKKLEIELVRWQVRRI